jgi:hypothetical protein
MILRWPNYLQLGLAQAHIPDLIRMVTSEDLYQTDLKHPAAWAPIHAWRALGQLRATEAIAPLTALFETRVQSHAAMTAQHDFLIDEIPDVLGMLGSAALPGLICFLVNTNLDETIRSGTTFPIQTIAQQDSCTRPQCLTILKTQLAAFAENGPLLNGFLISALVQLHAKDAAPLIQAAFDADAVDPDVIGDWQDVCSMLEQIP